MLDKIQLFKVSQWILILYLFKGIILRSLLMPNDALSCNSSITRRAVLRLRKAVGILCTQEPGSATSSHLTTLSARRASSHREFDSFQY